MTTKFADHLLGPDDHASRPAASAVPEGTLYACTDHPKVYQSDGSSTWSDWFTAAGVADILDLDTAETDTDTRLAPDGAGGVEWVAGGGGGLTPSYLGKNAIGGNTEQLTTSLWYTKAITLAGAGLLAEVEAYVGDNGAFQVAGQLNWGLFTATSSQPHRLIKMAHAGTASNVLLLSDGAGVADDFRWFGTGALSCYLSAGDYFVGFWINDTGGVGGGVYIAYDGSGSDLTAPHPGWDSDLRNYQTLTNSTKDYSIRARILS